MSRLQKGSSFLGVASTSQESSSLRASEVLRVTLLGSEWRSSKGGLSTINRELAIQLAKLPNVDVSVYVPRCSEEDRRAARSHDVQLIEAQELPGHDQPVDWLASLPEGHHPHCVIGHGVHLGRQIPLIQKQQPCKWIQVVHTAPEELGMFKSYKEAILRGEKKHCAEVKLCEMADEVVAIGPKLADAFSRYLRPSKKDEHVFTLTPSIFTEFCSVKQASQERKNFCVLLFGRSDGEDFKLKGYDIAVQAIAQLQDKPYQLMFVGAPKGKEEEVKNKLLAFDIPPSQLTVRCFKEDREQLGSLFCEADLAIMPSRTEGFGLTGLEALSAGLPILVSGNSGLGEVLKEVPSGYSHVVESEDPLVWANAIRIVRQKRREVRLEEATLLQEKYATKYSWQQQCKDLVKRMVHVVFGDPGTCKALEVDNNSLPSHAVSNSRNSSATVTVHHEVKTPDTEVIVRARSYKSQRKNEEPWRLQVEISRTPEVKITSTSCNCEAGAGLCNHAIGLVYLLEHYRKLGLKSVPPAMSKTSLPQTWHVPERTAGINPREVQEVLVQQVKPPSNDATQKNKIRRLDGVRSTLYNTIPEHFGSPKIIDSMRDIFKQYEDMQVNSIVPETESLDYVNSKLGRVAHGSVISYQQRQNTTNDPKIHINVEGPQEPLPFGVPLLKNNYTFVPTLAELNFAEGLSVSQAQSCLYEEETREQSDTQKWHDLRAQRLSSSKFKDVCARRADFESLAVRQLKKTVQTAAMRHGINTEEEAASAYADSGDCNVFPAGIVINPSCPHLAASPDRRVYDPSENNPWGLLEIKCPITDSISQLKYLKCVNGVYKLRKTHSYYYQIMGQMMLTGCEWVDFYVYCKSDFHLERVRFDAEFCSEMKMKLDKFYFEYLLPEL